MRFRLQLITVDEDGSERMQLAARDCHHGARPECRRDRVVSLLTTELHSKTLAAYLSQESIKKWVLKPYFGLGSRVKRPGIPRIGDRFSPFTGRTSTRIFMLSALACGSWGLGRSLD
jgi:hypothetical protein